MIRQWLIAFLLTQLIEAPIYWFAQRRDGPARPRWAMAALALGASAITHPPLWAFASTAWVHSYLAVIARWPDARIASPTARYIVFVVLFEALVVLVEGAYFAFARLRRPWLWALVANTTSVMIGLALRALFGVV